MKSATIGELTEFVLDGTHGSPVRTESGVPVLSAQNVKGGRLDFSTSRYTSEAEFESFRRRLPLAAGDVLLTIVGTVGRAAVVEHVMPLVFQRSVAVLRPRSGQVASRFLFHAIQSEGFQAQLARATNQSSQAGVYLGKLKNLCIPLVPLVEQQRIAAILDQADALRAKRRAALAQLDALAQSIFLDMFGDPATNPMGWPRRSLADVFDIARGGSPRPIDDFITDSPDGINWVMIGDATDSGGKFITRTKKRIKPEGARRSRAVKPGDFLLTNSMSFGRPYIMKTSGCIHDGWLVLSPRAGAIETEYFYTLLGSAAMYAEFVRLAPGATVKNLNIDLVRGVTVPVAPLELQKKYASLVAEIDEVRGRSLASLARMDDLFGSLQTRAFSGTLALIPS
ncbi:MAG: restriction endonuclease subunit S [Gemmatimonas sp.]|uniref:restriction endonuclease subunit S n=1 Tax=Gemmatimonas sp. TaxID=1962908 RepID=UPI0022BFEB60|nr:restriction endonuclease subunit S [Gemmatimonas sp.]MCZ8012984.1 restriction endonuclease subunit S [Gemmatimonas sp.]MCZ8265257.1 restriction endonuclease subunit S [Gemmatimonas sp.]